MSVLTTAWIVASAAAAGAQIVYNGQQPSRFVVGADFAVSQPKGEFADNVPNGYGFNFTGMFRLDPKGYLAIRADVGGVQYGHEHQSIGFPGTGRVDLNLDTDNRIGFGGVGLQFQFPDGWFRPYANASIAAMDFSTQSCVSGTDSSIESLCHENHNDWSHAGIFGGGLLIPFGNSLGSLNLGARYHYGARATYLKKGDIIDNPDGSITLNLRNSKTDLVLWQLGVSFVIPRPTSH
ncbi:MAG TPA: hypothetical protein VGG76_00155 [Gemmatimonadaceae bacterium]